MGLPPCAVVGECRLFLEWHLRILFKAFLALAAKGPDKHSAEQCDKHEQVCAGTHRQVLETAASFESPTALLEKERTMKIKLATSCFVIGTLLGPVAAFAAEGDTDRTHPMTFVKDSAITVEL